MAMLADRQPTPNAAPRFRTPPWTDGHAQRRQLEQRLPADHLARAIDRAVGRLDLAALRATYRGTGSPAHPPERLLRVVLYELRRGRHRPAAWHRDAREGEPVRWLLRGAVVARGCWYAFRDRVGPLLADLNRQEFALALLSRPSTAIPGFAARPLDAS